MTQAATIIASQIMPLNDEKVILPNTAIAEIINFSQPDAVPASVKKTPDWLLGMLEWRGLSIPVVAFENMFGGKYEPPGKRAQFAVLNIAGDAMGVAFMAVPVRAIPQLMQIEAEGISVVDDAGDKNSAVACHVVLAGDTAIIPDMEDIERQLMEVFLVKKSVEKKPSVEKKTKKKSKKKK